MNTDLKGLKHGNQVDVFNRQRQHERQQQGLDASQRGANCSGCSDIDIRIDACGDVNMYNCSTPSRPGTTPPPACPPYLPFYGACLPAVPGPSTSSAANTS